MEKIIDQFIARVPYRKLSYLRNRAKQKVGAMHRLCPEQQNRLELRETLAVATQEPGDEFSKNCIDAARLRGVDLDSVINQVYGCIHRPSHSKGLVHLVRLKRKCHPAWSESRLLIDISTRLNFLAIR